MRHRNGSRAVVVKLLKFPDQASDPEAASGAEQRDWLLSAFLGALWLGATAWLRPLAIPDEGRYVGVASEMLRAGRWLVPTENGHPFFHKPPLFYWLTAGSMHLFGSNVWAARTASLVSAVAVSATLFRFVQRWNGNGAPAWTVVAVLATMPLFYGSAQYANLDPLVAACIALAVFLVVFAALSKDRGEPHLASLAGGYAAAALGVLAKGMIGIVLPALVLLAWGLSSRRLRRLLPLLAWWPGWLLFLGVAAPWFVAVQLRFPDFARYFFIVQQVERFGSSQFNNLQPGWYYPAVLLATTLPWSPWMLAALLPRYRERPDPFDLRKLMWAWLLAITAFFSIPNSKPIGYILPVLPPLAWIVADAIHGLLSPVFFQSRPGNRRLLWELRGATFALASCICITTVAAAHFYQPKSNAALSAELRARHLPGEPVVFLGNYYFDIPFYARLQSPVWIVDRWSPSDLAVDGWRRELVDAERFDLHGATPQLLHDADLASALAGKGRAWIVGPAAAGKLNPWLDTQELVYVSGETALWHTLPVDPARNNLPAP